LSVISGFRNWLSTPPQRHYQQRGARKQTISSQTNGVKHIITNFSKYGHNYERLHTLMRSKRTNTHTQEILVKCGCCFCFCFCFSLLHLGALVPAN